MRGSTGDRWIILTRPVTRKMFPFDDVNMNNRKDSEFIVRSPEYVKKSLTRRRHGPYNKLPLRDALVAFTWLWMCDWMYSRISLQHYTVSLKSCIWSTLYSSPMSFRANVNFPMIFTQWGICMQRNLRLKLRWFFPEHFASFSRTLFPGRQFMVLPVHGWRFICYLCKQKYRWGYIVVYE